MDKIILLGYMGSGKTIIAKLLAKKIGLEHLDLDDLIESHEDLSISEIFASKGEIYFRKVEHQILTELIRSEGKFVLSLGGGTPCYANNHEMFQGNDVVSIYLKASIETLYQRLISEKSKRPIIAHQSNEKFKEFIAMHLFERSYFYNKATKVMVVDGKSPDNIVIEIEKLLV